MSFGSILLRLLLSLCLVLNGTGTAAASAHLPMKAIETAATAERTAGHAMPCHGGSHDMATMPPKQPPAGDSATNDSTPSAKSGHGKHSPDCCKSGTCRCACVHIAQAGVPTRLPAVLAHGPSVRALALGHTAPALPHPIRPPIG